MYKAADSISFLNWLNPVCFLIKILSDKTLYSQILYESHRKKKHRKILRAILSDFEYFTSYESYKW